MSTTSYHSTIQTFDISKLFDLCKIKTLYSASAISSETGVSQEKSFAITDNERDFFDITLKSAASVVYDALSQDTKIVVDPFQYNVDGKIIYKLMVHGDWDEAQVFGLNTAIEMALVDYVIKEWFRTRGLSNQFQAYDASFTTSVSNVKNLLNRRKVTAKKNYTYV